MYCHQPLNQFGKIGQKRLQKWPITHCFLLSNQLAKKAGPFPKHLQWVEISKSMINCHHFSPSDKNIFATRIVEHIVFDTAGVSSSLWTFSMCHCCEAWWGMGFWRDFETRNKVSGDTTLTARDRGLMGVSPLPPPPSSSAERWGNRNIMAVEKKEAGGDVTGFNPTKTNNWRFRLFYQRPPCQECCHIVFDGQWPTLL